MLLVTLDQMDPTTYDGIRSATGGSYLGYWREGLGKLFSFGGLGVWTLVDVVLIAVGYIRPEDGSYCI